MSQATFTSLKFHPDILKNLAALGLEEMTPIQAHSLPHILAGKDVIGQGKTGSGKTAAFALGVLQKLKVKRFRVQSLILCPTRELADQVAQEVRKLGRSIHNIKVLMLCGGMPFGPQVGSLEHGAHIIVGTPGRIEEHLRKETLSLSDLEILVLDEADRMLDMGFQPALDAILGYAPQQRQTLLFSATYPDQIQSIAKRIMLTPMLIQVATMHEQSSVQQYLYQLEDDTQRLTALCLLLLHYRPESAVVFCNTKRETQYVADELRMQGFSVLALNGDLEQRDREQALVRFENKSVSVLVATDLAARGLDIDALDAVINYQIAHDPEVHVHRIGRTGRAGNQGIASTLFTEKERHKVVQLEVYLDQSIAIESLPPMSLLENAAYKAPMVTLLIDGGKKQKLRPGDILGALTAENGVQGTQVGKIKIADNRAYVAVNQKVGKLALKKLTAGKLKGRSFRARQI